MNPRRTLLLAAALLAPLARPARADDAATHAEHAQALYNVGKFADAAVELEHAYELDPQNTRLLFNLAQAYRMAGNLERAAFELHRYLEDPNADEKPEAQRRLAEIEAELNVAAEKAAAVKSLQDQLQRTRTELAAAKARIAVLEAPQPEKLHIALEYGTAEVYLVGTHVRSLTNNGRVRWMWLLRDGDIALEHGVTWTVMPVPYTAGDGSGAFALFSTIMYDVAARTDLSTHFWASAGLGAGFATFSRMQSGNPFGMNGMELSDAGGLAMQAHLIFGYRWSRVVSTVIETSVTASTTPDGFRDHLTSPLAYDLFTIGLHVFR